VERCYSLLFFLSRRVHALTFGQAPLVQMTGLWVLHCPIPSACASRLALVLLLGPISCTGGLVTRMDAICSGACTSTWLFTWTSSTLPTVRTHRCLMRFDAFSILSFLYCFCDIRVEVTARLPHEGAAKTLKTRCSPFTFAPFITPTSRALMAGTAIAWSTPRQKACGLVFMHLQRRPRRGQTRLLAARPHQPLIVNSSSLPRTTRATTVAAAAGRAAALP